MSDPAIKIMQSNGTLVSAGSLCTTFVPPPKFYPDIKRTPSKFDALITDQILDTILAIRPWEEYSNRIPAPRFWDVEDERFFALNNALDFCYSDPDKVDEFMFCLWERTHYLPIDSRSPVQAAYTEDRRQRNSKRKDRVIRIYREVARLIQSGDLPWGALLDPVFIFPPNHAIVWYPDELETGDEMTEASAREQLEELRTASPGRDYLLYDQASHPLFTDPKLPDDLKSVWVDPTTKTVAPSSPSPAPARPAPVGPASAKKCRRLSYDSENDPVSTT